jgi:hypothetical protein
MYSQANIQLLDKCRNKTKIILLLNSSYYNKTIFKAYVHLQSNDLLYIGIKIYYSYKKYCYLRYRCDQNTIIKLLMDFLQIYFAI